MTLKSGRVHCEHKCTWAGVCVCHGCAYRDQRTTLENGSLLSSHGELNSDRQAWWQAPLPTEPFHLPKLSSLINVKIVCLPKNYSKVYFPIYYQRTLDLFDFLYSRGHVRIP